ncbi:MAG: tetratricopeptide repeat protein [Candidatus Schekmanbacteria bacterium]|nr:tetratricopeptide repeat protein [Candidatus Schekmanbacteria bacterium]
MKRERLFSGLFIFFLSVLCLLIYWRTLNYPFHYDDALVIENNENIRNIADFKSIILSNPQRAVLNLSFAVNYAFGGLNTFGYHILNIAIHFLNGVFFYLLVMRLFPEKMSRTSAIFSSLLFLVNPVNVESVTYISSRSGLLCAFFYLLAILFYIKKNIILSLLFFIFSCFSKESGATLPLILLLIDYSRNAESGKKWNIKESLKNHSPYWGIILLVIIERIYSLGAVGNPNFQREALTQFYTQVRSFIFGLKLMLLPLNLNVDHYFPLSETITDAKFIISALFLIAVITLVYFFRKSAFLFFSFGWIFISQLPTLIIPVQDSFSERWLYLPSIGMAFFIASLLMSDLLIKKRLLKNSAIVLLAGAVFMLSSLAFERNHVWKDNLTLWTDALNKSPQKGRPYINVGNELLKMGRLNEASEMFKKASSISDLPQLSEMNLAYLAFSEGRLDEAERRLKSLIANIPDKPEPYYLLGTILEKAGKFDEAIAVFSDMKSRFPEYTDAVLYIGAIYMNTGRIDEGERVFNEVLARAPNNVKALMNLGSIAYLRGKSDEARQYYLKALDNDRGNADGWYNLGLISARSGNIDDALSDWDESLKISPRHEGALLSKGIALSMKGEYGAALDAFDTLIRINPKRSEAYQNAAQACEKMGDIKRAQEYLNMGGEIK